MSACSDRKVCNLTHSRICSLLSLLIAPTIGLKHCLSMTGYSFFSWNLALLCSFPLELYGDSLRIPMMLPLVVLGIPSSLALVSNIFGGVHRIISLSRCAGVHVLGADACLHHHSAARSPAHGG